MTNDANCRSQPGPLTWRAWQCQLGCHMPKRWGSLNAPGRFFSQHMSRQEVRIQNTEEYYSRDLGCSRSMPWIVSSRLTQHCAAVRELAGVCSGPPAAHPCHPSHRTEKSTFFFFSCSLFLFTYTVVILYLFLLFSSAAVEAK